jgi:putative NIF3 family GTP cyclohydrolase 1 type 2
MAARDEILAWTKEYLDLESYPDYGPMGLQVAGAEEVGKIACGVSASRELFRRSAEAGAQLVLVHHGLFWDREPRVVDPVLRERLRALFDADLTLAAYHLALDAHPEVGNNALLAGELGVECERRFADGLGFGGRLAEPLPVSDFSNRVRERLGQMPLVFSYGPELVERVAVCSGGGRRGPGPPAPPRAAAGGGAPVGSSVVVTSIASRSRFATGRPPSVRDRSVRHPGKARGGADAPSPHVRPAPADRTCVRSPQTIRPQCPGVKPNVPAARRRGTRARAPPGRRRPHGRSGRPARRCRDAR